MDPKSITDRDLVARATQKASDCLPIDQLEAIAANGEASESARFHVANCAHCQRETALLSQFLNAEPTAAELDAVRHIERQLNANPSWKAEESSKPALPWWKALFAKPLGQFAVAGVAAMLAIGLYVQNPSGTGGGSGVTGEDVVRSTAIEGIEPAGDVPQAPQQIRWTATRQAASYRLRLLDVDGVALWQTASTAPQVDIPAATRALMLNKKTLFWKIEALDAKGAPLAQSPQTPIRVVLNAAP
jgi:hypothetical protein